MLEELFKSLDENVFTEDLKKSLTVSFNEAVEAKTKIRADELLESKVEVKATEMLEAKIAELEQKTAEYEKLIVEQKTAEFAELREAELDTLDEYMSRAIAELVTESVTSLQEAIVNEKANLVVEAFDAMILAGGVEIATIQEAVSTANPDLQLKIDESVSKIDTLVEENIALSKQIAKLEKEKAITEAKDGLTLIESERFTKLADMLEFHDADTYKAKLTTLLESVSKEVKEPAPIVEKTAKPSYAHLI